MRHNFACFRTKVNFIDIELSLSTLYRERVHSRILKYRKRLPKRYGVSLKKPLSKIRVVSAILHDWQTLFLIFPKVTFAQDDPVSKKEAGRGVVRNRLQLLRCTTLEFRESEMLDIRSIFRCLPILQLLFNLWILLLSVHITDQKAYILSYNGCFSNERSNGTLTKNRTLYIIILYYVDTLYITILLCKSEDMVKIVWR